MSGARALCAAAAALVVTLAATDAGAHAFRSMLLDLRETAAGPVEVVVRTPILEGGLTLPVAPRFPPGCSRLAPSRGERERETLVRRYAIACDPGLRGGRVSVQGLSAMVPDAAVTMHFADGRVRVAALDPGRPSFRFSPDARGTPGVAAYFPIGVAHILGGADHLLFVLGLLGVVWLSRAGTATLIATITAFTAAHSLTLALSLLGGVRLPPAPVEIAIAGSILLLAVELAAAPGRARPSLTFERPWLVAFAFGLLHGFGFAGALAELGLPESARLAALLLFNLGVEAGQLLFVAAFAALALTARRALPLRRLPPLPLATATLGALAAYWTLDRVAGAWGPLLVR